VFVYIKPIPVSGRKVTSAVVIAKESLLLGISRRINTNLLAFRVSLSVLSLSDRLRLGRPNMNAAKYYDKIYSFKDYEQEAKKITRIVEERLHSEGRSLLDVACGTGRHIEYLKDQFDAEGLDISREMLEIARVRNPNVTFHQADMIDFGLDKKFDVITCLFSAIGYAKTLEHAGSAIACMSRHLVPGGLLIVEPWFEPEAWHPGTVHATLIDEPNLKIARVNTSFVKGRISYFDLHHLIGTPEGTTHFVEHHELGLFTIEEMRKMFADVGLSVTYDVEGIAGRGLYVGEKTS